MTDRTPKIAAIVLAAGRSTRMEGANKMLIEVGGKPLVRGVVEAVLGSSAGPVIAVTGHEAESVVAALDGAGVRTVHNPDFAAGLSTSLATGLGAVPDDADGAIVCLGDMPGVTAVHVDRLIEVFGKGPADAICVPFFDGRRGNPVLWGRRYFDEMVALSGDTGARALIERYETHVRRVEMVDGGILLDVDTRADLDELTGGKQEI